jgi:3-phenylpropionate/trans-cinnamate dioxygenase ferredoxin reductase subunit
MVNILRVEGAENEGIHYLRAYGNSDAIRADADDAEHVVLVGGSYIGCEVSATLAARGVKCSILTMEDVVLSNTFGEEAGGGVHPRRAEPGGGFHRGAGVRPDTMLAARAGLEVEDGIVCDAKLETSAEGIYAAGDCCSYDSVVHGRRLRVEHWDVAMHQGIHVARNMLGEDRDYDVVPYFFSDLSDWAGLESVGPATEWDETIWRGDVEAGEFLVWYLAGGKVAGALSVGRSEDLAEARRMLADGTDVSAAREALADADSHLASIS